VRKESIQSTATVSAVDSFLTRNQDDVDSDEDDEDEDEDEDEDKDEDEDDSETDYVPSESDGAESDDSKGSDCEGSDCEGSDCEGSDSKTMPQLCADSSDEEDEEDEDVFVPVVTTPVDFDAIRANLLAMDVAIAVAARGHSAAEQDYYEDLVDTDAPDDYSSTASRHSAGHFSLVSDHGVDNDAADHMDVTVDITNVLADNSNVPKRADVGTVADYMRRIQERLNAAAGLNQHHPAGIIPLADTAAVELMNVLGDESDSESEDSWMETDEEKSPSAGTLTIDFKVLKKFKLVYPNRKLDMDNSFRYLKKKCLRSIKAFDKPKQGMLPTHTTTRQVIKQHDGAALARIMKREVGVFDVEDFNARMKKLGEWMRKEKIPKTATEIFAVTYLHLRLLAGGCPSGANWYLDFLAAGTLCGAGVRRKSAGSLTYADVGKYFVLPTGRRELTAQFRHIKNFDKFVYVEKPFESSPETGKRSAFATDNEVDFVTVFEQKIFENFGVTLPEWFSDRKAANDRRIEFAEKKVIGTSLDYLGSMLKKYAVLVGFPEDLSYPFQRCFRHGMVKRVKWNIAHGESSHAAMLAMGNWTNKCDEERSTPNVQYGGLAASSHAVYHNSGQAREMPVFEGTPFEKLQAEINYMNVGPALSLKNPRDLPFDLADADLLLTMLVTSAKKMSMKLTTEIVEQVWYLAGTRIVKLSPAPLDATTVKMIYKPAVLATVRGRTRQSCMDTYAGFVKRFLMTPAAFKTYVKKHKITPTMPERIIFMAKKVTKAINKVNKLATNAAAMEAHLKQHHKGEVVKKPSTLVHSALRFLSSNPVSTTQLEKFLITKKKALPALDTWTRPLKKTVVIGHHRDRWSPIMTNQMINFVKKFPEVSEFCSAKANLVYLEIPEVEAAGLTQLQVKDKLRNVVKKLRIESLKRSKLVQDAENIKKYTDRGKKRSTVDNIVAAPDFPDVDYTEVLGNRVPKKSKKDNKRKENVPTSGHASGPPPVRRVPWRSQLAPPRSQELFQRFQFEAGPERDWLDSTQSEPEPVGLGLGVFQGGFDGYAGVPAPGRYSGVGKTLGLQGMLGPFEHLLEGYEANWADGMGDPNINLNDLEFSVGGLFHPMMVHQIPLHRTVTTTLGHASCGWRCVACGFKLVNDARPATMIKYTWLQERVPSREPNVAHYVCARAGTMRYSYMRYQAVLVARGEQHWGVSNNDYTFQGDLGPGPLRWTLAEDYDLTVGVYIHTNGDFAAVIDWTDVLCWILLCTGKSEEQMG